MTSSTGRNSPPRIAGSIWITLIFVTPTRSPSTRCCVISSLERVIEIGSGFSSALMLDAADRHFTARCDLHSSTPILNV